MTSLVDRILKSHQYPQNTSVCCDEENRLRKMMKEYSMEGKITKIQKLNNKHLYASFVLKKQENEDYEVIELLHCTSAANVSSIEETNLDWRRVKRSRYGKGVSFSEDADYADRYSSDKGGIHRAFIVCDVLVGRKTILRKGYYGGFPENDVDTFQSSNGSVYVKFEDFTFYPKYAIFYRK